MCNESSVKSKVNFGTVVYTSIDSIKSNPLKSKKYILKEKVDSNGLHTILENMNPKYSQIPIVPLLYCPDNTDIFTFACDNIYLDVRKYIGNFSLNCLNFFKKDLVIITNLENENNIPEKFVINFCKIKKLDVNIFSSYTYFSMYFYYSVFTEIQIDASLGSLSFENCIIDTLIIHNIDPFQHLKLKKCNIKLLKIKFPPRIEMCSNTKIECIEYTLLSDFETIRIPLYSEQITLACSLKNVSNIIVDSINKLEIVCTDTKLNSQFNIVGNIKTIQIAKEYINDIYINNLKLDAEYYKRKNTLKYCQYVKK